ncbi:uncharacterized protein LOC144919561 [Branchiostoma floridae x Branchiostoma belcheri]
MGVDLATYRARIGCFQNPTARSARCQTQASAQLVGVILAQLWNKVMGRGPGKFVRCCYVMMSCLLAWFLACKLLLKAGDIEQNPGPTLRETDPDTDEVEEQSLTPRQNDDGLLELDLSGRNMSSMPNKVFQQNDIQVLNLQRNSIKVIPTDIGMLFQLRHLDISCNKLSHLPDSISSLSNLEELNISENKIHEFPKGMKNMQALKLLIYRNNALVTIPEQVFSFPVIEELDVSDNELSEVSPLIGNLLSVKVLNLRWNQSLQTLPKELCQLSNLEEINLSVCDIGCLPDDIGKLRKLKTIKLSCNRISSLPASVFESLGNLEELDLCDNAITEIPESISNLKKLNSFKVADNQLTRLPTSIVELTELHSLDISYNSIIGLPDNFEDLVHIANLNLKHNKISLVPFLKCDAFPALQEVHLTGNPIQLSESQLVSNFCKKRRVTLCVDHRQYVQLIKQNHSYGMRGNIIILWEQGNEVNASRYKSFDHIDLSNQRLKTVPYSLDIHDPSQIMLSHNRIETFPVSPPVMGSSNLTHLDLSHNLLSALPEEIRLLSNLRNLNVSHNKLHSIPLGVCELLSLEIFNMSYNFVQQLPPTVFTNLKHLDLSYNKFQTVPDSILQTKSITYLNLLGNDIASLPADIVRLTNLDTLCYNIRRLQSLSHVPFELKTMPWKNIEWAAAVNCNEKPSSSTSTSTGTKAHFHVRPKVGYLEVKIDTKEVSEAGFDEYLQYQLNCTIAWFQDTLREVNLSNCNIQSLPEQIFCLSKLTTVNVSNNMLSSFPSRLIRLQGLQVLNVSNCSLTTLPDSIGDLPSLTNLDISRNDLKTLPNSLSNLPRIETLSLQYCGCHQVEFLSNLASLRHVKVDIAQLISIRVSCLDQFSAAGTTIRLVQRNTRMWINNVTIDELRRSDLHITPDSVKSSPSHEKQTQPLTSISISHFDDPDILNCLLSILCTQNLQHLKVANCSLTALPDSLKDLQSLTNLDISGNPLKILPSTMSHLSTLKVLNVANCSLTVLPDSIGDLPSLTNLDISRNNLKTLPNSLSNLPRIETLSLQYCGCHQVEFLSNLASLRHVEVDLAQLISIRVCCLDKFSATGTTISLVQRKIANVISIDKLIIRGSDLHITPYSVKSSPSHENDSQPLTSISISDIDDPDILNALLSILCTQNLQYLRVANCCLTALPDSLRDLQSLTSLDISNNPLKTLPSTILHMATLKNLNVSNCSLTVLPDSIGDLPSLTSLDISRNDLKTLPNSLSNLPRIETLSLQYCGCHQVEFLANLTSLRHVKVDLAQLISIRIYGLDEFSAAGTIISLIQRNIWTDDDDNDDDVISIDELRGSDLDITPSCVTSSPSHENDSQPLTSISIIDIDDPDILNCSLSILCTQNLQHLKVANCSLTALPDSLGDLQSLTSLDISNNSLKTLPNTILHMATLKVLNVSNCSLTALPDSLGDLQSLTSLDISRNPLKTLPSTILHMATLKVLNVSNCTLTALPDSLGDLQSLTSLDISRNPLKTLPSTILHMATLKVLNVSNCSLTALPDSIGNLQSLTNLDISVNPLKTLPSTILHISTLKNLNVSNCSLTVLPDSTGDLPSLTSLNLSRNNLKTLPNSLSNLRRIETLSLQYCGCHQVEFLSNLTSLRHVEVDLAQLISIRVCCLDQLSAAGTTISLVWTDDDDDDDYVISIDKLRGP